MQRLDALRQKRQAGTLSSAEKTELEQLEGAASSNAQGNSGTAPPPDQAQSQARRDARQRAVQAHPELAQDTNAQAEQRRHAQRVAKLERAREVAQSEGKTGLVTRIDTLLAKENARHEAWFSKRKEGAK